MERIAVLGLGIMGGGMATNWLRKGYPTAVWNRTPAKAEALIAEGAIVAATPAEAAKDADVIVAMVADDAASRAVWLGGHEVRLEVRRESGSIAVQFGGQGAWRRLASDWQPGDPIWSGSIDGKPVAVQVRPIHNGVRLAHQGVEVPVYVFTEAEAASARLMPVVTAADTGKKLLCPMPGLVVSIAVTEGQEVKAGETLAVVEAMKMQNVLRAERDGTVKKIYASAGATLAVDALILEFA